jgi:hypothetical protein
MRKTSMAIRTITFIGLALGLVNPGLFAQMLSPQMMPTERLLVLKNGEVLRGQLSRNAEQVIVVTEQGSRLVIPIEETEFESDTMEDAYWGRLARTRASDTQGLVKLFHWCVKNKLLKLAENQIDILLQSEIKAADLANLNRQLNVAMMQVRSAARAKQRTESDRERDVQTRMAASPSHTILVASKGQRRTPQIDSPLNRGNSPNPMALAPIQIENGIGSKNLIETNSPDDAIAFSPLPMFDESNSSAPLAGFAQHPPLQFEPVESPNAIQQVGFDEDVYETISPSKRLPSKASLLAAESKSTGLAEVDDRIMISMPELDRETRSLPPGIAGYYRSRVERGVVFGCSATKCHDSNSRVMPLMHMGRSEPITRRQSQRNLHNILKYIDQENAFSSPLFLAATTPHAGADEPIMTLNSTKTENLIKWMISLSDDPQATAVQALQLTPESLANTQSAATPVQTDDLTPAMLQPIQNALAPIQPAALSYPDTIGEIPQLNSGKKVFVPADPFDPEIFNRKYH